MWRATPLIVLACCGATCQPRPPKVETVYVTVEKMIDVPEELTRDCYDEPAKEQSYGEAKRLANLRRESLSECNGRMRLIRRELKP